MGLLSSLTGSDAAKAAKKGAKAIQQANNQNIGDFNRTFDENGNLLSTGVDREQFAQNRLLEITRGDRSIRDEEGFASSLDESIDNVNRNFAGAGKSLSGQRLLALRDANFGAEDRALNRLLTLGSPQFTNSLIGSRNLRDANVANARLGGANAFAAGQIGAANARSAGLNNLISLGKSAATAASGLPPIGSLFSGGNKLPAGESIGTINTGAQYAGYA